MGRLKKPPHTFKHFIFFKRLAGGMIVTILDGYVDEPSRLGVPPYISPYARYCAGAVVSAGHEPDYMTIDQWRDGRKPIGRAVFVLCNPNVPGRYLRGMPMSGKELASILGERPDAISWRCGNGDPDALLFDTLASGMSGPAKARRRTPEEWEEWARAGAVIARAHPDFPQPLIAEIDMSVGCPRYISGGCSFCSEMDFGAPVQRAPENILAEVNALLRTGVTNFRLGGQSCIFSYMSEEVGVNEAPRPNVPVLTAFFGELAKLRDSIAGQGGAGGIRVLHTDNANPAVIARHPEESKKVLAAIVSACTSGNVLSLGLESADPAVREANNLNATAAETLTAIRMINEAGAERGPTGLPKLLPGLNFVAGLDGETAGTFDMNLAFLRSVLDEGLTLRRINIRQVKDNRRQFHGGAGKKAFIGFKRGVREEIDTRMLERVVPVGTVLKDVHLELARGRTTFGRQVGTYPILVGLAYESPAGRLVDVLITAHGQRSITGIEVPIKINEASMSRLAAMPGLGKKRAARIFTGRPYADLDEVEAALDDPSILDPYREFIVL